MLAATHIIVFSEKVVFRDMGAQQGVAHQVDKAQTQALESRYGTGKEQVGSHTAEPRPSPSDLQSRKGAFQGVVTAGSGTKDPCAWSCFQERQLYAWLLQTCITGVRAGQREPCVGCLCLMLRACLSLILTRHLNVHSSNPGAKFPEGVLKYIYILYIFVY